MTTLSIGDPIEDFTLRDQYGKIFRSRDYCGKKIVIFFYPKDDSVFCTRQACAFRDSFPEFTQSGVIVVGINFGEISSHAHFAADNKLPFILLSDIGNMVLKSFGVKNSHIFSGRETFLIDEEGIVRYKYRAFFDSTGHAEKMLAFLQSVTINSVN
ncbi:peroxiredoxin [Pedobacter sp. Leaf216]|uniref:peroxiredoxin n=1 Tax=Pedobacter sp. Leaf216 TaxID=1735684 RepID=UPI000A77E92E|nr:peroxiredoxin [Pedobacter sp. Leaf216]